MGKEYGKNGKPKNRIKGFNGTSLFVPIWMQKKYEEGMKEKI